MNVARATLACAVCAGVGVFFAGCTTLLGIHDLVPPDASVGPGGNTGDVEFLKDVIVDEPDGDAGDGDGGDAGDGDAREEPAPVCNATACMPPNPCDQGQSACGTGGPCVDLDAADPGANGIACGTELVCASGSCLSSEWAEWPMPNYEQPSNSLPNTKSYSVNDGGNAGTVTDLITGLMWQQTVSGSAASDAGWVATFYTWADAKSYCASLQLAGYSDWRMPTIIELVSVIDYSLVDPAIATAYFPQTPSDYFWASTPDQASTSSAPVVWFFNGGIGASDVSNPRYVRCVR